MWQVPLTVPQDIVLKKGTLVTVRSHLKEPPTEPFYMSLVYRERDGLILEMLPGAVGC